MSEKEKLPFWLGVVLGLILGMTAVLIVVVPQMDRSDPGSDQSVISKAAVSTPADSIRNGEIQKGPIQSDPIQSDPVQSDPVQNDRHQTVLNQTTLNALTDLTPADSMVAGDGGSESNVVTAVPAELESQVELQKDSEMHASKSAIKPLNPTIAQAKSELTKEKKYGIALVLDDVGYDLAAVERILDLSVPVAISILPDAPFARKSAILSKKAGQVVMLHLPMQPEDPSWPMTEDFLLGSMNEQSIRETFQRDLEKVPFVEGVNNHMGSRLTQLLKPMRSVMKICREKGLFFVDSRTSAQSVAATTAESMGIAWASRSIFLDHEMTLGAMKHAWQRARNCAKKKLSCVVIAHPRAKTITFLENYLSKEDAKNMVSIRHLLQTTPIVAQRSKATLP